MLGTSTWHAYNDFAGRNLYNGGTRSRSAGRWRPATCTSRRAHGRRVATTHPPDPQLAAHVGYLRLNHLSEWGGSAGLAQLGAPFAVWAERNGYEIDVASSADLEDPSLLSRYRLLLSIGHDEYWSGPMRDSVEAFIAGGGNVAFLSGNTAFWQIRYEDDGRTIVGYKGRFADDPCYRTDRHAETTTIWSDHELGRPENDMTGVSFSRGGYHRIGKPRDQRRRRLHGPPARPLAVRGSGPRATATCWAPARPWSATSATAATSPTATACRTRPGATARRTPSRSSAPRPPPPSPGTRRPGRPSPHVMSESEFTSWRLFGEQGARGGGAHPARPRGARHLHARAAPS